MNPYILTEAWLGFSDLAKNSYLIRVTENTPQVPPTIVINDRMVGHVIPVLQMTWQLSNGAHRMTFHTPTGSCVAAGPVAGRPPGGPRGVGRRQPDRGYEAGPSRLGTARPSVVGVVTPSERPPGRAAADREVVDISDDEGSARFSGMDLADCWSPESSSILIASSLGPLPFSWMSPISRAGTPNSLSSPVSPDRREQVETPELLNLLVEVITGLSSIPSTDMVEDVLAEVGRDRR